MRTTRQIFHRSISTNIISTQDFNVHQNVGEFLIESTLQQEYSSTLSALKNGVVTIYEMNKKSE